MELDYPINSKWSSEFINDHNQEAQSVWDALIMESLSVPLWDWALPLNSSFLMIS